MQHSRQHTDSSPRPSSYTPAQVDNAKSLTSSMMDSQGRLFSSPSQPSRSPIPPAGDREPPVGHPSTHEPHGGSQRGLAIEPRRSTPTGLRRGPLPTVGDREPLFEHPITHEPHVGSERATAAELRRNLLLAAGGRAPPSGHPGTREPRSSSEGGHMTEPSRISFSTAGDREPLLGYPSTREPHDGSGTGLPTTPRRKKPGRFGLPIIVFCRLFNTIFAICTVDKANRDAVEPWNLRINRLVFDFCWVILVWNIFALAASIVTCVFFPRPLPSPHREAGGQDTRGRGFRDKLHAQFAINDAVLALITLVLLMIACHIKKELRQALLPPPVVAMVSSLV
ncbi:hypothetical protein Hte_007904 [Hypoxylon texense]